MALLEVSGLNVYYGVIHAIKDVSFVVNEGEIVSLIGANGAGKTTILHTVSGLVRAKSGCVSFDGIDLTRTPAHKIVGLGMAHVPEGRRIFAQLSVYDNLRLGAYTRNDGAEIRSNLDMVYERFPRLKESGCRHPVWWRAADAGHGAGVDVQSKNYFDGRTVNGIVAAACKRNF